MKFKKEMSCYICSFLKKNSDLRGFGIGGNYIEEDSLECV